MSTTSLYHRVLGTAEPTQVVAQYVWGARRGHRDELILRDRDPGGSGTLTERLYATMDYFNGISILDEEGTVQERYRYSAFGVRTVMAPDFSLRSASDFDWESGFQGQFLDLETGWINYGYRYYIPSLGRWPNRDPIGEEGGMNLYAFAANNGANGVDYLGLKAFSAEETIQILKGGNPERADTTVSRWVIDVKLDDVDNGCYCELTITKAEAIIFLNVAMGNLRHELKHVADYLKAWTLYIDWANRFDGYTHHDQRACKCWKEFLDDKVQLATLHYGIYLGDWGHVNPGPLQYPDNLQRRQAEADLRNSAIDKDRSTRELQFKIVECESIEQGGR